MPAPSEANDAVLLHQNIDSAPYTTRATEAGIHRVRGVGLLLGPQGGLGQSTFMKISIYMIMNL